MKTLLYLLVCAVVSVLLSAVVAAAEESPAPKADAAGFVPLFNGTSLDGWHGDLDLWKEVDGVIVGSTEGKTLAHNSFLATTRPYKNFVLKIKFKLRDHNSGVQFRSKQVDDFVVTGYQADMADRRYTGVLYEEQGRGILADVKPQDVEPHFNKGDWNEYVITADGPHITLALNGFTTADYTEQGDEAAQEGVIALQLHKGPTMQVEFKDIAIKVLP